MSAVTLEITAPRLPVLSRALRQAPATTRAELVTTTNALLAVGVGLAQEEAPVDEGVLRASIDVVEAAGVSGGGVSGTYGSRGIIYARIQEEGGVIVARRAPYLVFQTRSGNWVRVKQVTITGKRYMHKSAVALRPRARDAYRLAAKRALAQIGAS